MIKNKHAILAQMKFYVDECLPPDVSDAIAQKRGFSAVHAARDLGFASRDDDFHVAESRRQGRILITSNHREFKRGFAYLKKHPGIVVFNTGAWTNREDLLKWVALLFDVFQWLRVNAKPPRRTTLFERRLVLSSQVAYLEDIGGRRLDIFDSEPAWKASPQVKREDL